MLRLNHRAQGWVNNEVPLQPWNPLFTSLLNKTNNWSSSMCFIPLHKVRKHKKYNMSFSQVELKLTDFTCLGAYTLPTHGLALRVCVRRHPSMCVCATSSLETKNKPTFFNLILSAYINWCWSYKITKYESACMCTCVKPNPSSGLQNFVTMFQACSSGVWSYLTQ